jgi:hypothetical protein
MLLLLCTNRMVQCETKILVVSWVWENNKNMRTYKQSLMQRIETDNRTRQRNKVLGYNSPINPYKTKNDTTRRVSCNNMNTSQKERNDHGL